MRFAELCVLEIGKDAGRVERECRIAGQIAGERSICHTLRAVVLNAAVDKAGIVAAELLRDGIAAEYHGLGIYKRIITADQAVRVLLRSFVVCQTVAVGKRGAVFEVVGKANRGLHWLHLPPHFPSGAQWRAFGSL